MKSIKVSESTHQQLVRELLFRETFDELLQRILKELKGRRLKEHSNKHTKET